MAIEFNEEYLRELTATVGKANVISDRLDKMEADVEQLKSDNRTLYEMSANIRSLTDGVICIKDDIKDMRENQGEMKNEIQELKQSPVRTKAEMMDNAGKLIITAITTGLVAFILGQICPAIFG